MDAFTPIVMLEARGATRRALQGADATDPVRPDDRRKRRFTLRRATAAGTRRAARKPRPAPARAH